MKNANSFLFLFFFLLLSIKAFAQPAPALAMDSITTVENATIDVAIKVDNNDFWNITTLNGTIAFDPTILSYSSFVSSILTQMSGSNINASQAATGIITWTWNHPITVGQSANFGDNLFVLSFDVIGASGTGSDLSFEDSPQSLFWNNFAAWSGSIITTDGYVYIDGCTAPISNYTSVKNGLDVFFTNTGSNDNNATFFWDFGDGNTSTDENPTHTYSAAGTYNVCLTITNDCDQHTYCKDQEVCVDPSADFSINSIGFGVMFSNLSMVNGAATYYWDFGDGSVISNDIDPTYLYADTGNYEVCLIIVDQCGSDTACQNIYVCQPAFPNFSNSGIELTKTFTNTTVFTLPPTFSWNFGDGNTSTDENPIHTYAAAGTYSVCLLTDDACGPSSSYCKNVGVCEISVASFGSAGDDNDWTFTNATPPLFGQTFTWNFGDGNTSTVENPNHTFIAPGIYEVCLVVADTCGSDTSCQDITVLNWINTKELANQSLSISPNPSSGKIWVQSPSFEQGEKLQIRLLSLEGKTIFALPMSVLNTTLEIDLSDHFPAEGLYILEIAGRDQTLHQKIFLK